MNKMRVVVMGCGGSGGVPYAGNVWGVCDPTNPKNARMRPSIYIEQDDTRIVIDTGPDFRLQLNRTGIKPDQLLNAVLYTHAHFDHVMGLDDLRTFWHRADKIPVPIYGSQETMAELSERFSYAVKELDPVYPATVAVNHLSDKPLRIGDLVIENIHQVHGHMSTTGFRIGDFAYSTDLNDMPPESLKKLKGIKTWIVGSFFNDEGSYNHAGFTKIKEWVEILKPEMTYLTHLTASADYETLCRILPDNIRPAYDGLELFI